MNDLAQINQEIETLRGRVKQLLRLRRSLQTGRDLEVMIERICLQANIQPDELTGSSRARNISDVRCIFAWRAFQKGYNKERISQYLNKDRSSVYYMLEKYQVLMNSGDESFQTLVNKIH